MDVECIWRRQNASATAGSPAGSVQQCSLEHRLVYLLQEFFSINNLKTEANFADLCTQLQNIIYTLNQLYPTSFSYDIIVCLITWVILSVSHIKQPTLSCFLLAFVCGCWDYSVSVKGLLVRWLQSNNLSSCKALLQC